MSKAKEKDTVQVHYTGSLTSGEVFDSSREREPLEFTLGEGKMIEGFEKAVNGMEVNETKKVTIPSDQAYGDRREEMVQKVPREQLPEDLEPKVGQQLVSQLPDGKELIVRVTDVADADITVDANHPLAGQDLVFELELVDIK